MGWGGQSGKVRQGKKGMNKGCVRKHMKLDSMGDRRDVSQGYVAPEELGYSPTSISPWLRMLLPGQGPENAWRAERATANNSSLYSSFMA